MSRKQLYAAGVIVGVVLAGVASGGAQSNRTIGADESSAEAPRATTGSAHEQRRNGSPVGTVSDSAKAGPGIVGPDGNPPAPRVRDDPQHRCLAPYPICR